MNSRSNVFTALAQRIGDLDSPFYAEERQRDVWNEASAIGFQCMLWGCTALAGLMAWAGGVRLAAWACALLGMVGLASWVTLTYAKRQGISGLEDARLLRPRLAGWLVVYLLAVAAIAYRLFWGQSTGGTATSFIAGAVIGAVAGVAGLFVAVRRQRASGQRASGQRASGQGG